jgi:MYXO-CTERM domain-containing protein
VRSAKKTSVSILISGLCLLALALFVRPASAGGRVEWSSKTLKERSTQSWQVEVKIFLSSPPDIAHVPMKFEFLPYSYFERSMVDGDKLQERTVPLEGRQPLIESVDVGFMDPGSGKIENRTKFSFKVTRAHGYEAGEYKVTIRDGRNGQIVGVTTTLRFEGENEIIDRRSIVFTGDKKKKKEEPKKVESDTEGTGEPEAAESEGGESTEGAENEPEPQDDAALADDPAPDPEGEIKEKPGGCGCRAAGTGARGHFGLLGLALLGLVALRTRRRR